MTPAVRSGPASAGPGCRPGRGLRGAGSDRACGLAVTDGGERVAARTVRRVGLAPGGLRVRPSGVLPLSRRAVRWSSGVRATGRMYAPARAGGQAPNHKMLWSDDVIATYGKMLKEIGARTLRSTPVRLHARCPRSSTSSPRVRHTLPGPARPTPHSGAPSFHERVVHHAVIERACEHIDLGRVRRRRSTWRVAHSSCVWANDWRRARRPRRTS